MTAAKDSSTLEAPTSAIRSGGLGAIDLCKSYRGRQVVKNVSLQFDRREAIGLLGPNGAGKTTTFYMITGLVRPDSGRVLLDGQDVSTLPMYRRARMGVGYLPQEASIFRTLSVEANIMSILEVVEPDADARRDKLESLLQEFSVTHVRQSAGAASGGASRLPAPWPATQVSFCSTSHLPALTPSRLTTFVIWSRNSKTVGSAC